MSNNFKKLKNNLPQIKFYDSMQPKWRPFLMFNHFSNLRSQFCNTDIYGLRFNKFVKNRKDKKISIFEEGKTKKNKGVILGNSTAFGEGSSTDSNTISAILSKISKFHFYNLCGRGYSGYQEIMNFFLLSHKIKNLKKIVVISGLNDSILPFYIKNFDDYNTPTYGYNLFNVAMSSIVTGWKKKALKYLLQPFFGNTLNFQALNRINFLDQLKINKTTNILKFNTKKNLLDAYNDIIDRNFFLLSKLEESKKIKIYFILQPVGSWCEKQLTKEEKILFSEENKNIKLKKIYQHVDKKKYKIVRKIIIEKSKKYRIKFLDLNQIFSARKYSNEWFFLSRFHINDNCNKHTANIIKKNN